MWCRNCLMPIAWGELCHRCQQKLDKVNSKTFQESRTIHSSIGWSYGEIDGKLSDLESKDSNIFKKESKDGDIFKKLGLK